MANNVPMRGRFKKGVNKGRYWEVFKDPAQPTGYTRKNWDPNDTSNDGKPTEYFEPFNYGAAEVDEQQAERKVARRAHREAARRYDDEQDEARQAAFWKGVQEYNERAFQEDKRRFGVDDDFRRDELTDLNSYRKSDLKLKEMDSRTRLQLGLKELELREREGGAQDMRARERNVLDYVGAIGNLRLPMPELIALSQRAVQGIVPGGAAPGGAPGAAGGGALTPDQWAALSQGVARDYEVRQIGQGSARAA